MLAEPLEHLQSVAVEAVLPLFRAASDEVESLLLQMHEADWSGDASAAASAAPGGTDAQGGAAVLETSRHIRRLEAFLKRFRADYLSQFVPPPSPNVPSFAALLCQRLAGRALAFFVRHATLLRPLGEQGKLQLAKVRTVTLHGA